MIIPQKLFHRGKILRPMSSFPARGSYERRVPRVWLWRSEGFDLQSFHRTEGNRDSTLGGCTPSLMCTKSQGRKAVTPKRLSQTDLHWRVFCRGGGQQWLAPGLGPLAAAALGNTHWHEPLQKPLAPPNGLQTPGLDFLRPNNQQGRNTAPPSASTHQQTSQLKVYRAQPCPPEGQDPLPATTSPSLQEAYTRLLESFINQRMDSRSKEKLQFCSLRNRIIITDKLV